MLTDTKRSKGQMSNFRFSGAWLGKLAGQYMKVAIRSPKTFWDH